MNTTNLQSNLFIGTSELENIIKNSNDYAQEFVKSLIGVYGVVKNENDASFTNLKIVQGSSINYITLSAGVAFDSDLNLIKQTADYADIIAVPADSTDYYVILSGASSSYEVGTVSIATNGQVTGITTEFLRFRAGDYPLRLKFPTSALNTLEYEISSITSDTVLQLVNTGMSAESGLPYQIYGAFPQGLIVADKKVFSYIRPSIRINVANTHTTGTEFLLAKVKNTGAVLTVTDLRTEILTLSEVYTKDEITALFAAFATTVYTKVETDALFAALTTGASTNIQYNASNYLEINKTETIYSISGGGEDVADILYDDASTVATGKILVLNIASTGYNFLINGSVGSNITYLANTSATTLLITSETLMFFKTSTKWLLFGGISKAIEVSAWNTIVTFIGDGTTTITAPVSPLFQTLRFRKNQYNQLQINGWIRVSPAMVDYITFLQIAQLPTSHAPIYAQYIDCYNSVSGGLSYKIIVEPDGLITLAIGATIDDYAYIDGIIPLD